MELKGLVTSILLGFFIASILLISTPNEPAYGAFSCPQTAADLTLRSWLPFKSEFELFRCSYQDPTELWGFTATAKWESGEPDYAPVNTCGDEAGAKGWTRIYGKTMQASVEYHFDNEEREAGMRIVALGLLAEAEKLAVVACDWGIESSPPPTTLPTSIVEGYELFFDGMRVGHEPTWDMTKAMDNFRWNVENQPVRVVTAKFNGQPLIYGTVSTPEFNLPPVDSPNDLVQSVDGSATISEPGKATISLKPGMKIPYEAVVTTTTGLVKIENEEGIIEIAPETKVSFSEHIELLWGKIKYSSTVKSLIRSSEEIKECFEKSNKQLFFKENKFRCMWVTVDGKNGIIGTEFIISHDKAKQISAWHIYEGKLAIAPIDSDDLKEYGAGTTVTIKDGQVNTKILTQSAWDYLKDEFEVPGHQLFFDDVRVGYEPTWDEAQSIGNFRVNVEMYPEKVVTALFNGQPLQYETASTPKEKVPGWIKNNAKWWSEGQIGDSDFVGGIQHLIKEKIIDIPDLPEQASGTAEEKVPDWIKNNAGWWADGQISEDDFVNGIKWLVEKGIIRV